MKSLFSNSRVIERTIIGAGAMLLAASAVWGHSDGVTVSLCLLGFIAGGVRLKIAVEGSDREMRADAGGAVALAAAIACGPLGCAFPAAMVALGRIFIRSEEPEPLAVCLREVAKTVIRAAAAGLAFILLRGSVLTPWLAASLPAAVVAAGVFALFGRRTRLFAKPSAGTAVMLALGYFLAVAARAVPSYVLAIPALPAALALLRLLKHAQEKQEEAEQETGTQQLSFVDSLTGLANQRYLEMFLGQEMSRSARTGRSISVMMIDLDDFQELNADQGTVAADDYIGALGAAFKQALRDYDVVARYKDDEYVIVLPDTPSDIALDIAERLHSSYSGQVHPLRATFSVGVASYPEHGATIDTLIGSAHHALNRAKFSGKNTIRSCHQLAKAS